MNEELKPCFWCGRCMEIWDDQIRCKPCYYLTTAERHNNAWAHKQITALQAINAELQRELSDADRDVFSKLRLELKNAEDALASSEKECEEQSRLNGMGSEREAALLGEVERLKRGLAVVLGAIEFSGYNIEQLLCERDEALQSLKEAREIEHKNWKQANLDRLGLQEQLRDAQAKAEAYREVAYSIQVELNEITAKPEADKQTFEFLDAESQRILEAKNGAEK